MTQRDKIIPGTDDPQRAGQRHHASDDAIHDFAIAAARLLHDAHSEDVLLLDVRELSDVSDYLLLASGTSDRQMRSVADDVEELAGKAGLQRFGRELDERTTWIVLDFIDVIVHLFTPDTRSHYDLEMLWGDAKRIHWQREKEA